MHYYPRALGDSGVTLALWSWARASARSGCEVAILHAGRLHRDEPRGLFVNRGGGDGIELATVPHGGSGRATLRPLHLERHLGADDVLILHEGWVLSNLLAARAAWQAGVPYIVMPHGVYHEEWRRYLRPPLRVRERLERWVLEHAAAVHVFFPAERAAVGRLAPAARFLVSPTGSDGAPRRWTGGGGYLAWIGRYDPEHKGLDLLVRALALVPDTHRPRLRLRGYDYRGGLTTVMADVRKARLEPWVEIGGPIGSYEKAEFLARAEGTILPSRWESHSIALLESMAMGVPCIVSDHLPISSDLAAAGAAILTSLEPVDIAEAIGRLPLEGPAIGDRAKRLTETDFAWSQIIPRYLEEVRLLAGPGG